MLKNLSLIGVHDQKSLETPDLEVEWVSLQRTCAIHRVWKKHI